MLNVGLCHIVYAIMHTLLITIYIASGLFLKQKILQKIQNLNIKECIYQSTYHCTGGFQINKNSCHKINYERYAYMRSSKLME